MLAKLKSSKGFTIIEVMIVLAIAGLIILIVLLAIPALQRNGRNTAIKNDASAVAAAISTFASDNDGKAAVATTDYLVSDSTITIGASTTAQAEAKIQAGTAVPAPVTTVPGTTLVEPGNLIIVLQKTCNNVRSARAVSIWYSVETSKAPTAALNNKCVDA